MRKIFTRVQVILTTRDAETGETETLNLLDKERDTGFVKGELSFVSQKEWEEVVSDDGLTKYQRPKGSVISTLVFTDYLEPGKEKPVTTKKVEPTQDIMIPPIMKPWL